MRTMRVLVQRGALRWRPLAQLHSGFGLVDSNLGNRKRLHVRYCNLTWKSWFQGGVRAVTPDTRPYNAWHRVRSDRASAWMVVEVVTPCAFPKDSACRRGVPRASNPCRRPIIFSFRTKARRDLHDAQNNRNTRPDGYIPRRGRAGAAHRSDASSDRTSV